jgi:hypothetical protein
MDPSLYTSIYMNGCVRCYNARTSTKTFMTIETLLVLLVIALVAAILGRAPSYSLPGCLVSYVLACLGAVGGWIAQQRFFGPEPLVVIPWFSQQPAVSIVGASLGALVLALLSRWIGRRVQPLPRRRRY